MPDQPEGSLAVDIYQNEKEIVIIAPIAGVKINEVDVSITEEVLTIKGERNMGKQFLEEESFTKECFWGPFSRSIILPETADAEKIKAVFQNGILEIRIPKVFREKTKIVKIKT